MSKILTVEEFLLKDENYKKLHLNYPKLSKAIQESMIEFAKLHVEAALKEALENIPCLGSSTDIASYEEVEEAVLNAYLLENIK